MLRGFFIFLSIFVLITSPLLFSESFATSQIKNHDGISGWSCYPKCDVNPKYDKKTQRVEITSEFGNPSPSLKISGDVSHRTVLCANKIITSDWYIQKVSVSGDVRGGFDGGYPVIEINEKRSDRIYGEEWRSFEWNADINNQNSVSVNLCVYEPWMGSDAEFITYDNIKITTIEVDPSWVQEQQRLEVEAAEAAEQARLQQEDDAQIARNAEMQASIQEEIEYEKQRAAEAAEREAESIERQAELAERELEAIQRAAEAAERENNAVLEKEKITIEPQSLSVSPGDVMKINIQIEGIDKSKNVIIMLVDPEGDEIVKESVMTNSDGFRRVNFELPGDAEFGTYQVKTTTKVNNQLLSDSAQFQVGMTSGGGCLIATAAYGSELAPQVQMLREIRDNQLMNTESGSAFMTTFNELYYSFSPTIADLERQSPMFKEIVKAGLTPMISTLSLMESAETESEVLGLGLSVIVLNLAMYIGAPAIVIVGIKKRF